MKIHFARLEQEKNKYYYHTLCGSDNNWLMNDLKTVKGYLNRLKKTDWIKTEKYILMIINDNVRYIIANGKLIDYNNAIDAAYVTEDYCKYKEIPVHFKFFN